MPEAWHGDQRLNDHRSIQCIVPMIWPKPKVARYVTPSIPGLPTIWHITTTWLRIINSPLGDRFALAILFSIRNIMKNRYGCRGEWWERPDCSQGDCESLRPSPRVNTWGVSLAIGHRLGLAMRFCPPNHIKQPAVLFIRENWFLQAKSNYKCSGAFYLKKII